MRQHDAVISWLLDGDPSIRWQTLRDLVGAAQATVRREQRKVATTGWGARLLSYQESSGQWGGGIYTPKWTSTTYTMVLLRSLGLPARHPQALKACRLLLDRGLYRDGGINFWPSYTHSEECVTGMVLAVAAYSHPTDDRIRSFAEYLLRRQMNDGGWNCFSYWGATHSSFHTTISVLEGLLQYQRLRPPESPRLRQAQERGREFLLMHRLFRSHRTGKWLIPR